MRILLLNTLARATKVMAIIDLPLLLRHCLLWVLDDFPLPLPLELNHWGLLLAGCELAHVQQEDQAREVEKEKTSLEKRERRRKRGKCKIRGDGIHGKNRKKISLASALKNLWCDEFRGMVSCSRPAGQSVWTESDEVMTMQSTCIRSLALASFLYLSFLFLTENKREYRANA